MWSSSTPAPSPTPTTTGRCRLTCPTAPSKGESCRVILSHPTCRPGRTSPGFVHHLSKPSPCWHWAVCLTASPRISCIYLLLSMTAAKTWGSVCLRCCRAGARGVSWPCSAPWPQCPAVNLVPGPDCFRCFCFLQVEGVEVLPIHAAPLPGTACPAALFNSGSRSKHQLLPLFLFAAGGRC